MHYIVVSLGGNGGVFPVISIAARLRARGHRTTLIAQIPYSALAMSNGLHFIPLSTPEAYKSSLEDKFLQMTRYRNLYELRYCVGWNCLIARSLRDLFAPDTFVLAVDRASLWADLFANARFKMPVVRLQPDLPPVVGSSGLADGFVSGSAPSALARKCEAKWRSMMGDCGLRAGPDNIRRLWSRRASVPTIALWPEWLVSGSSTTADSQGYFGFLPPPDMLTGVSKVPFTNNGKKLIVFVAGSLGTTRTWNDHFFEVSVNICRALGCNGLVLGAEGMNTPVCLPDWFMLSEFVPLEQILPHASAIVHHGGIGTAAAAIRQAVPQLIIPRVFSQPRNAEWLRRSGLCIVLEPRSYTASEGLRCMELLLAGDCYRVRAKEISVRFNPETELARLCESLERWSVLHRDSLAPSTKGAR